MSYLLFKNLIKSNNLRALMCEYLFHQLDRGAPPLTLHLAGTRPTFFQVLPGGQPLSFLLLAGAIQLSPH